MIGQLLSTDIPITENDIAFLVWLDAMNYLVDSSYTPSP
jgi:hypothetical protein